MARQAPSSTSPLVSRDEGGRRPFMGVVVDARGPDEADSLARARTTMRRWRRTGLSVAVICSRSGAQALADPDVFDLVLDESRQGRPDMDSTVRLLGEATLRLEAAPMDILVVAHAVISVAAADALGFRRIVGVERDGDAPGLVEAGARSVVDDLRGLRFPRVLPPGLSCLEEIERWRAGRQIAVFLDYDGTLAPIVPNPHQARLAPGMGAAIATLSRRFPVAVLSGRDRADLIDRVGLDRVHYAGGHGIDIQGPDLRFRTPGADDWIVRIRHAAAALEETLHETAGIVIERKIFSVAVHFRMAHGDASRRAVEAAEQAATASGLEIRRGRQVRELVPALGWHKGRALEWLRDSLALDPAYTCLIYIGDDETDEEAFRALGPDGIGLRPGPRVAASLADYHLTDIDAVREFLVWLGDESRPAGVVGA